MMRSCAAEWLRLVGLRRGRSATRGCRRVAGIGGIWRRCGRWCHRRDGGCVTPVTLSHECSVLTCGNAVTGVLLQGEKQKVSPREPCRSEERRVGKECRFLGRRDDDKQTGI